MNPNSVSIVQKHVFAETSFLSVHIFVQFEFKYCIKKKNLHNLNFLVSVISVLARKFGHFFICGQNKKQKSGFGQ